MSPWRDSNPRPPQEWDALTILASRRKNITPICLRHPAELPRCSIGVYRCKFLSNLTSVAAGKTTLTSFGSGRRLLVSPAYPRLGVDILLCTDMSKNSLLSCCGRCRIRTCDVIAERTIMIHIIKFCALPSSTRPTFQVYRVLC